MSGKTLLVDLYGCDYDLLQDVNLQHKMLVELPEKIGMTPISAPAIARWDIPQLKDKGAWGHSGTILFAESHAYYHTWPEFGFMLFDLTSCNDFDEKFVTGALRRIFGARRAEPKVVLRGRGDGMVQDVVAAPLAPD